MTSLLFAFENVENCAHHTALVLKNRVLRRMCITYFYIIGFYDWQCSHTASTKRV